MIDGLRFVMISSD